MNPKGRSAALGILAAALVAACSSSTSPKLTADGTWDGSWNWMGTPSEMSLQLNVVNGNVTGSGAITTPTETIAVSVQGTEKSESIHLGIAWTGQVWLDYDAIIGSKGVMTGTLNDPAGDFMSLDLTKQ